MAIQIQPTSKKFAVPRSKIQVIGTSHIAKQSIQEVSKKILDEKPEIVCVELDKARIIGLFQKQPKKVSLADLKAGGFGFLFMILGRWIQKKLGAEVGIMPGADMKTAVLAARNVGAKIYVIDKPINQTLYNLSKQVSIWEKLKLFFYIIFSPLSSKNRKLAKQFDLTKVPAQKLIDQLISEMRYKFPQLFKVLLDDRNVYMANQLKNIAKANPKSEIIAVVGAGHEKDLKMLLNPKIHDISTAMIKNAKTGKFLFLYRDNKPSIPYPNTWVGVGGGIKKGETPLQALKREIDHEIGVKVYDYKLIEKQNNQVENLGVTGKKKAYIYTAKTDAKLKDICLMEGPVAKYFSLNQALRKRLHPKVREFILKYRKQLEVA
jgi:ADP-ribose pyrophosphatase YjhB (NUDIX family)